MSFDKPTRYALAKMVGDCRRSLTAEIRDQLQGLYGLQPDGSPLSIESLLHLDERGRQIAAELRAWQEHLAATEAGPEEKKKASAFDRLAHETAFTLLNRLSALRMCEERGHVIECVRRGMESDGFVLYERFSGGALGTRGETYRLFLERMFGELAVDLGAVFDLRVPQSLLFPRERCLEETLDFLNSSELADLWQDDETIGWIYQYFNSKEEKEAMREKSSAPRNSRELVVRNQFFTPRYIVEFLTDNTLGRVWYEMRKGRTKLVELCSYLVRWPNEVFLNEGEEPTIDVVSKSDSSPQELASKPDYILFRGEKDPRDLKILDPACGSGHFLLYAFDLLATIYEEAWTANKQISSEATGRDIRDDFPEMVSLRKALPGLILRHNLYGIDIDPRACQIAALALWLRAQRSFQGLDFKMEGRPKITKSNIVCAEPMPGEREMLGEFLQDLRPVVLRELVQLIFDKMSLAGEAGPLLKIEEEIRGAIAEAKLQWLAASKQEQLSLWPESKRRSIEQMKLFDVSGISDEQFWIDAEDRVLQSLRNYAEQVTNGLGFTRRLFADDAALGFAFIDLCRKHYDAVLMNPPFGDASIQSLPALDDQLSEVGRDIGAAFLKAGINRFAIKGIVGALLPTGLWFKPVFERLRDDTFWGSTARLRMGAHLGGQVLDGATVTASPVVISPESSRRSLVVKCVDHPDNEGPLLAGVGAIRNESELPPWVFCLDPSQASVLPGKPFSYWLSSDLLARLSALKPFEGEYGTVKQGTATADEFRFCRAWWEVPIGGAIWSTFTKSSEFSPLWDELPWVLKSGQDLREIRATGKARVQGVAFFGTDGVTFPRKAVVGFNPRFQPGGSAFSDSAPVAFPKKMRPLALLGFLNSRPVEYLIGLFVGELQGEAGVYPLHYQVGVVQRLPWPELSERDSQQLEEAAQTSVRVLQELDSLSETSRMYGTRWFAKDCSIGETCEGLRKVEANAMDAVINAREIADNIALVAYGFNEPDIADLKSAFSKLIPPASGKWRRYFGVAGSDIATKDVSHDFVSWLLGTAFGRWDIRFTTGEKTIPISSAPQAQLPLCPPALLQNDKGLPLKKEDVQRLQSTADWFYPLDLAWDGILVDDPGHPDDIEARALQIISLIWKDRAGAIQQETSDMLGVRDIREYFRKPVGFFADHLKNYSKGRRQAPIYWPLSTHSGSYTLWIYYPNLDGDLLYTAVNKFLKPKIADTKRHLQQIEASLSSATGREGSKLRESFEGSKTFLDELSEFQDELLRVAGLPFKPNLNDGVLITASPLWKLFRLPRWRKDLKECWERLNAGEYDWAHLAYSIWPDRVGATCKKDYSIAVAHSLENLCEVAAKVAKQKKPRKKTTEYFELESQE